MFGEILQIVLATSAGLAIVDLFNPQGAFYGFRLTVNFIHRKGVKKTA